MSRRPDQPGTSQESGSREPLSWSEGVRKWLVARFVAGIVALVPLMVTLYALILLFNFSDRLLFNFLPPEWRPDALIGVHIPGLGIVLSLLIILFVGTVAHGAVGKSLMSRVEQLFQRLPVLRNIYTALRNFLEGFVQERSRSFLRVVAIEYPRKGLYTLAFVTSEPVVGPLSDALPTKERVVTVFVPTTPNPTSGFMLLVPQSEMIDLPLRVDDAFRLIVSGGVLANESAQDARQNSTPQRTPVI